MISDCCNFYSRSLFDLDFTLLIKYFMLKSVKLAWILGFDFFRVRRVVRARVRVGTGLG